MIFRFILSIFLVEFLFGFLRCRVFFESESNFLNTMIFLKSLFPIFCRVLVSWLLDFSILK